ncbi:MAG TPA: carboxypeptidase regulatory-like domain-containing protein, partial [Gemmatimonadaceae bacterium]
MSVRVTRLSRPSRGRRWWRATCVAVLGALSLASSAAAQGATEIIRGRVLGPDSLPLADAEVRVIGLATRATQTARTDARGVYTLVFANPEGEYLLAVRRIGFQSRSLRLSRVGVSPVLGRDGVLEPATQELEAIVVSAEREPGGGTTVGEVGSSALADSILAVDPATLMDVLLSIPGIVSFDDSTFSVLGAAASQNVTTIDGIRSGSGELPPDALGGVRIVTASADPARGGFAGANISRSLRGGTDVFVATLRASGSNRGLVWNDPTWTRPTSRPLDFSGTASGPIVAQKLHYRVSWSAEDNTSEWYSLLDPRGSLLSQEGITLDSVAAVTSALEGLGVPLSLGSGPQDANSRRFRVSEVFDFTPNATTSLRLSHRGNWQREVGDGASITSFPTNVNRQDGAEHSFGLRANWMLHGLLNETTAGFSYESGESAPFTRIPSGSVRIGTDFSDGRTGLETLEFGGGDDEEYERVWQGEAQHEISWIPADGSHRVKLGGQLTWQRRNAFNFSGPLFGRYEYLTLADLVANQPASYERVLGTNARRTSGTTSSLWIGDEWRASPAWQWQGGLRFDFGHPRTRPQYNPAVDQAFGVRTDRVPDHVGVSPRIGFSWTSAARRGRGTRGGASTLGGLSAREIASMSRDLVSSLVSMQRSSTLPGIGISGTIGAYSGFVEPETIAELVEATGLPGTRLTLSCVGDAVPIPDWHTLTEGPTTCADGTTGTPFSIAQPAVRVFDPGFRPPVSWRANVGINGIRVPGQWIVSLQAGLGYNTHNRSTIDLNLNRTPHFFLADEANRPVYAPLSAVVPATGEISPAASRIVPEFATVSNMISDLRSYRGQFQVSLSPPQPLFNRHVAVGLSYSLNVGRSEARGSSRVGTTGDPFAKQWVPSSDPLHTLRFTASGRYKGINFGLSTTFYSGVPLTPLVSGDINGDGDANNDRAFIPDPATTPDTSLARQMTEFLAHARPAARRCLTSQFGRMAGANSCRTEWQSRIDLSASITPPSGWDYSDRLRLTFRLSNANGALIRALGLEDTPFGRRSPSINPNSTLLYVTGFDPATGRFRYRVNQLFGQPTNFGSARRRFAPAQLSLGLEYTFGGGILNPIARGLGLREQPGRPALTPDERRAAVARLKRDPVAPYLAFADSLELSEAQRAQLDSLSQAYHTEADTALAPFRNWVLSKGKRIFDKDLARPLSAAQSALRRVNEEYEERARDVL